MALAIYWFSHLQFCFLANRVMKVTSLFFILWLSSCDLHPSITTKDNKKQLLHVASPDWRDQIIYFVMLDRFQDGDPSNNDQGFNLYRPKDPHYFNGGDIQGLINRLDYIKNLGATAVWLTPPNANLWWNNNSKGTGYHGYWATDFKSIDKHFGTLETYKNLSHQMHSNDMYLIQDIVANHVGRFFNYSDKYDPQDTAKHFNLVSGNIPNQAPTQFPFNQNDRNNKRHQDADIYHWTPEITDYYQQLQEYTYQLSGLNDLNTSNGTVREALKDSFGYWIKEVGVDAFRLDTAKFMEPDFINDFLHSQNGLLASAYSTGRESFPVFGEIFETSSPYSDKAEQKISRFIGTQEKPGLNGIIGFPLYKSLENVFSSGQATSELSYRLQKQMEVYADPFMVLNFIDNHDVKRFQTSSNTRSIKQALSFIMTVPGIPVIYQGDEQGLLETREAMFAGGYHATQDKFDQQSELFLFVKRIAKVRKTNKALSRGNIKILADNKSGAGVFAYKRELAEGRNKQSVVIIFNTAEERILLSNLNLELSDNESLELIFSENFANPPKQFNQQKLTLELPERAIAIFRIARGNNKNSISITKHKHTIDDQYNNKTIDSDITLTGTTSMPDYPLLLVNNGELNSAMVIRSDENSNWSLLLKNENYGSFEHSFVIYDPITKTTSNKISFKSQNNKADIQFSVDDPLGDDIGFSGDYKKPTDQSYRQQMDIEKVSIQAGGRTLEVNIRMAELKSDWIAANGFDHVAFTVFFDLPLIHGLTELPLINSKTPLNFNWDFGHQLFGWGNRLFKPSNSSNNYFTGSSGKSPKISMNNRSREIKILYDAKQFGIANWNNTKVYITTWDVSGEGEYRPLNQKASRWAFSSKTADRTGALILDDIMPILITKK